MSAAAMLNQKIPVFCYGKFDLPALLHHAGKLRDAPCSCDRSKRPRSGVLNWVIFLLFEDGVEWVFRSPRQDDMSLDTAVELLESEVANMKYVKLNRLIPVPRSV